MKTNFVKALLHTALVASTVLLSSLAGAATTTINLTAQRMSTTLPDGTTVPMWGYCTTGSCSAAWAPGPTIVVPYDAGSSAVNSLTINLTNSLPTPTSLVILGQLGGGLGLPTKMDSPVHATQSSTTWPGNGAPDVAFTPPSQGKRVMSFATEVIGGGTTTLTWANLKPGTYLYETGTLPSIQAPMGLYGVLIVTQPPVQASAVVPFAPGKAYPTSLACLANTTTTSHSCVAYDADVALLFSEIDPVQNAAVDAAALADAVLTKRFDDPSCSANTPCYPAAVNYTPTHFLINGKAFDKTAPLNSAFALAGTSAARLTTSSGKLLVRMLNAGSRSHIPTIVGLPMALVAEDGNLSPGNPKQQNEVLLTAGKTHDVLVEPATSGPATTTDTTCATGSLCYSAATFPMFDRQLNLTSGNQPDSGMQGFLQVASAGSTGAGKLPAAVTPTAVNDTFQVPLNASINGNVKLNDIAVAAVAVVTKPTHGNLSLNSDGSFVYTATAGFMGIDTFTYNGNGGLTNTATVTLSVASTGTGVAPTAAADSYISTISTKFSVSRPGVLANDTDPTGYLLKASLVNTGTCALVAMNPDGSFSATKGAGATCSFTYVAVNSQGTPSASANVTVTFVPSGMATGLTVNVFDPATNVPVTDYRWIIQEDLTFKVDPKGTPPVTTRSLGTSFHRSHMNVVATGCVGPMSCGSGQQVRTGSTTRDPVTGTLGARHVVTDAEALANAVLPGAAVLDPNKHYYISILPGDAAGSADGKSSGHGMGGAEIKPQVGAAWAPLNIAANAYDWVPSQLSIYVYEDNLPLNGQPDTTEAGLGGFNIILMDAVGRSGDTAGQQSYDAFGMPLSNALLGRAGCPDELNINTSGAASNPNGNVVGLVYTCPNDPNAGTATADSAKYALAGHALIMNLTPARYDILAHPAAARQGAGEVWWQTETLEGTQAIDGFAGVKEPVYFQEFGPPGFHATIGFVNPAKVTAAGKAAIPVGTVAYTVTGKITNQRITHPNDLTLYDSGSYDLLNSSTCQVALNAQAGAGSAISIAQCDPDGNYILPNVPAGDYLLTVWDQWLDQIIQGVAVNVKGNMVLKNIPVLGWFTQFDQNIYMDANKNGVYDPGEKGISNVTMTTRYRDGGISNQTATDSNGNGLLAEQFPLFNWYVTEADTTRFKQSGVNVIVDGGGPADVSGDGKGIYSSKYATGESSNRVELPGAYSYGMQGYISQRNTINWGRTPYATNENGGIQGTVVYSTTRPFDDQRYNVQTLWEPLVPRVTMNLYLREKLKDGTVTLTKVDSTQTSSFDDWVNTVLGADGNKYILGTDQVLRDPISGLPAPGTTGVVGGAYPPGKQVNLQCPGQKPDDPFVAYTLGSNDLGRCFDGWHNWNQVQAAPYDGRYAFPSAAYVAAHPLTAAQTLAGQTLVSLPPGDYVVESVTPPGFQVVKEEDKNILNGDAFSPAAVSPAQQFGGLGNIFILPDQATLNNANPYNLKNADGIANNATNNLGVTASWTTFPECVGDMHRVPDYLSLFPAGGLVAPFAGQDRPLCDRKLVKLGDQMQASATFFVFTEVPMAANGAGVILDDATAEYYMSSPSFGEKASVPFTAISIKDFNGREISRHYSDQWGSYNVMTPSSWLVNPPTPSGYGPNMLITCMNDPGPIPDPTGVIDPVTGKVRMITDPQYNPSYSNFCYTLPFMPGRTTYLDTPVVPIAAFAASYNPVDCQYPDATPAIARVDSNAGFGPYVPAIGGTSRTLTIKALGDVQIQNPAYGGPLALTGPTSQKLVTRHYGFGAQGLRGKVTINGVTQAVTSWSDTSISVTVAAGTRTGELVITADNGVSSIDSVTVTVGGTAPKRVASGGSIQTAIDAATPGDLILVDAGTYNELVVMWKPVRLQGVGAASVIVNAAKYPTTKLANWRPLINSLFSVDVTTGNQTGISQVDPLPTQTVTGGIVLLEPSVLGTEEGAGITVLAADPSQVSCTGSTNPTTTFSTDSGATFHNKRESNFNCASSRIDGMTFTAGDSGGGIYVNGWAHNLEISNNRIYGNAGSLNGGVRIGVPYLLQDALPTTGNGNIIGFGYDNNVKIHHNAITQNGTVESNAGGGGAGGGLSICSGTDGYSVDHNWICGNYGASDGGGIGHIGFSQNGEITHNQILFNQTLQQTGPTHGGGIVVTGEPAVAPALTLGTGNVLIDSNVIRGNAAEGGHGGGIRLQQVNGADVVANPGTPARWFKATVINNMITNNVAGYSGGGISMADTLNNSVVDNNTVASNDSAGIAGVLVAGGVEAIWQPDGNHVVAGTGRPNPAGISAETTSAQLLSALDSLHRDVNKASNPDLANNIVWKNRSFFYKVVTGKATLCSSNNAGDTTTCNTLVEQTATGQCVNTNAGAPAYWDVGVVGDTTPQPPLGTQPLPLNVTSATQTGNTRVVMISISAGHGLGGNGTVSGVRIAGFTGTNSGRYNGPFTVTVTSTTTFTYTPSGGGVSNNNFNVFGKTGVTAQGPAVLALALNPRFSVLTSTVGYAGANNKENDPLLLDMYCNGSRETPEYVPVIVPNNPRSLQVGATADEGNNYITMRYGPLYVTKPTDTTGTSRVPFGNYHIANNSPAKDAGTTVSGVTLDIDGDPRVVPYDIGADETAALPQANLSITKTDGVTFVNPGAAVTYIIIVTNAGPTAVTGATVTDTMPNNLTGVTWTCVASASSTCGTASGSGNISEAVNLLNGGIATYTVHATVSPTATGSLVNTATVTVPPGISDPTPANNTATDTDVIPPPRPVLTVLDDFNRANAVNLGTNWSNALGIASITVNTNQAFCTGLNCLLGGASFYNAPASSFGAQQAGAFTVSNTTVNGDSLLLKISGGTATNPTNAVRVRYNNGSVIIETTTNGVLSYGIVGTLTNANSTFANGNVLEALVDATGMVYVWKSTTFVGAVALPNVALWTSGGGRIGMQLPSGARIDNFSGGTVP
ncbi:MAG: Ig-like domain-containing protein [Rhodoferax sp.]|uniref:Ig-like domain-containing protein n=1 Tax=Rhodoferax sp. TaxID=50421 RepID=UPI00301829EF